MTSPEPVSDANLGGKVGGRLAQLVAAATIHTRMQAAPLQAGVAQVVLTEFTNHVSDELRGVLGNWFRAIADDPDVPEQFRAAFRAIGTEQGQAWAWLGHTVGGQVLSGGLMDLISNEFAPMVNKIIAANPHGILSAGDAASAAVRGFAGNVDVYGDMNSAGLDMNRINVLKSLARTYLPESVILDCLRRGIEIDGGPFEALRRLGYDTPDIDSIIKSAQVPLTAEQLAAMWNRGIITTDQGRNLARAVGTLPDDFDKLSELGGEPPGLQDLLFAYRRGIIDTARLKRGIYQSNLRSEWFDVAEALGVQRMTTPDAIDSVNQNHMPEDEARRISKENGLDPKDFDTLVKNAGLPPSPTEVIDWIRRGLMTEQQGMQALYESRIKNQYVPTYFQTIHEIMPSETVRLMFSRGAMPEAEAIKRLQMQGYSPEDAAIILEGARADKTSAARDLTQSQIRQLYADRAITQADATTMLTSMGYDDQDAQWILLIADMARIQKFANALITKVRSGYVAGLIDQASATSLLDSSGIPVDQRDDVLALWDLERQTVTRTLTLAQVQSALKKGIIDEATFNSRLAGMGYGADDAAILLALTTPSATAT